ncbi:MAG: DUF6240 domain-containing protein [Lachnospiraceae bacterium]|nr:DUF6240 domain-containing protein [Lachnospiraceae bacterium]
MNIILDGIDGSTAGTRTNAGRETTSNRTPGKPEKTDNPGFTLDISGTVMDNSAYTGHGRTAEEIMLEAGQDDVTARRNYMAVMSNSMSDEDFAKLQKEGFHPGSTDIETVVTIVDHIKAALVKGGTEVVGYTDTISQDALKEIAGSEAFARELEKQFAEHDIPVTEENIDAVMEAWKLLTDTPPMTDGSVKYMLENRLEPTPENLYTAGYSAADGNRQGKGYYAAGEVAGYYAKKPEEIDFAKLLPQVQKLIEEAGYPADEENLEDAKWLVEKGIPLTADTFSMLKGLRETHLPLTEEDFLKRAAAAISEGREPSKMNLSSQETVYEQAVRIAEQVSEIPDEAVDTVSDRNLPFTLKNLLAAAHEFLKGTDSAVEKREIPESIKGRRLLEEVRLSMTVEANLRLLKRGFQIETAPLEDLVARLKEAETDYNKALMKEPDGAQAGQKRSLFGETLNVVQGIKSSPLAIVSKLSPADTLREVHAAGRDRAAAYEKAGEKYEELMTAPRRDMGDSIQKAFRNVDEILSDMELSPTDENRRAVRILGYNSVEITEENITQVRRMDEMLTSVVKELKPGKVLNMIREGVNPLSMSIEELSQYLKEQESPADEMESYSKFLYKLEKQNGISEDERSAYIGIYRLVHQIEKTDDAAVGSIWQTGAGFTLENLLSAVRSSKHKHMDYSVSDEFGGVSARDTGIESITAQIAKGFSMTEPVNREELQEMIERAGDEEAAEEFDRLEGEQLRAAVKEEESVLRQLTDYEQPVTAEHLLFASHMLKNPGGIWKQFTGIGIKDARTPEEERTEGMSRSLEDMGEELLKSLEGKEQAESGYHSFCERVQSVIEQESYGENMQALDVRAMSTLYKQMTFLGSMAKEENYEIPARIGDTLTSINLKIIHGSDLESKAAVSMETEAFGKVAAEFKMSGSKLEGLCICSSEEGTAFLKEGKELLESKLSEENIPAGEIYFAESRTLNLTEFSLKQSHGRQEGGDAGMLYKSARAFIGYVQETAIKKGNMSNEN